MTWRISTRPPSKLLDRHADFRYAVLTVFNRTALLGAGRVYKLEKWETQPGAVTDTFYARCAGANGNFLTAERGFNGKFRVSFKYDSRECPPTSVRYGRTGWNWKGRVRNKPVIKEEHWWIRKRKGAYIDIHQKKIM